MESRKFHASHPIYSRCHCDNKCTCLLHTQYKILQTAILTAPMLPVLKILEETAYYAGLLLAPAKGFGLRLRLFFAVRAKKGLFMLFSLILGHCWCSVVTSVTLSSTLSNIEKNPKKSKKS